MKFTFIDLFAGIGGFHQAMNSLGGECVFASEIDEKCKKTYSNQFKMVVHGDINECIDKIPDFDVLCGGFPCQTFSKAGNQEGFEDDIKGKLFFKIIEILKQHNECKYIILENVRNLADNEKFWNIIQKELKELNFYITKNPIILSPDNFGIPQNRERVYILGIKKGIENRKLLKNQEISINNLHLDKYYKNCSETEALNVLENDIDNLKLVIKPNEKRIIRCWEDFKKNIIPNKQIGSPIWLDYFGFDVEPGNEIEFKRKYSYYYQKDRKGNKTKTPEWKKEFILKNRELYLSNRNSINIWYRKYADILVNKTYRKFEWNCGENYINFKKCIIQIRQSGIRVKRANKFPSLVAIINTPIIWDANIKSYRRISIREAANLQSFRKDYVFLGDSKTIYKQLGNSVNVDVIKYISKELFKLGKN